MKQNLLKKVLRRTLFRNGAIRRIAFGPCAGFKYRVSDSAGMSAWYSGPERDHQRTFKALVQPGDTVIDVGANWGLHVVLLSHLVGEHGRVLAFEPFPPIVEELSWHVCANECRNVSIQSLALSDRDGSAPFVAGQSTFTGHLRVSNSVEPMESQGVSTVATRRLDSMVDDLKIKQLRLIKIDVEGAESRVLDGARDTLQRMRPFVVVDLHTPEQDVQVARLLMAEGYALERISAGPPIKQADLGWPATDRVWGTILARPKSS